MTPPTNEEKLAIVQMVDEVLGKDSETACFTIACKHLADEDPLPYLYDYLHHRDCTVLNLVTVVGADSVYRELLVKPPVYSRRIRWDGSIE